ncbi:helix-turn-helix domain-containing protein [Ciceribacter sp. L1K23]|uniref:helix-turn-helix domain-containing protein n=1 Tax=Ciceribacter sp. L1K23 TaxID=2820276 RepID=UPI001B810FCB|nr:helix-turn-helix domain-containing protein [Ciceribacter sp. L1K23]MBR0554528.1 helix-turn-helix domain-containing protein [Ciceribacter sp. L1K23]
MVQPVYVFDSNKYSEEEQFSSFCKEISLGDIYILARAPGDQKRFNANVVGYDLGTLKVVVSQSEAFRFSPQPRLGRLPGFDFWLILLRLTGHATIDGPHGQMRYEGKRLEIRKAGVAQSGEVSANTTVGVYLPRNQFSGMEAVLDQLARNPNPDDGLHPLLSNYLSALVTVLPDAAQKEIFMIAETTISMIRSCISVRERGQLLQAPLTVARLEVAKRLISSNLTSSVDLTPETLSSKLNMSRRQLYKLFESEGGVEHYVRSRRLNACYESIIKAGHLRPSSAIAEEYGFHDAPTFSRQFRLQFGCSPSELKQFSKERLQETAFSRWLRKGLSSDLRDAGTDTLE